MDYEDKKINLSFLNKFNKNFGIKYAPIINKYIDSKKLTMISLLWCTLIILLGFFARDNTLFLIGIIIVIILHQLTDSLYREVAKYNNNNEGFLRWGFFMNNLLDIVFIFSLFIAKLIIFYKKDDLLVVFLTILIILILINMYASLLLTSLNREIDNSMCIKEYCFSLDELRVVLVIILFLIIFGYKNIYYYFIIIITILFLFATIINIYTKQKNESNKDIIIKNNKSVKVLHY
jgi:hypothetical protein